MEVTAHLIELKPGSQKRVEEWTRYLREHRREAEDTLRAEGVSIESWFMMTLDGKDYLLAYMRADSMAAAQEVSSRSQSAVDAFHRQFKVDTWVRGGGAVGSLMVDLIGDREPA